MDRTQKISGSLDKSMKVLEIGASFSPIVAKADGWNAWVLDHTDQAGLRAKYQSDPNVDTARIEPVDFIWTSGTLEDAIPPEHHGTFDACIASHVIEHMPDPVGFYQSLEMLVRPTGIVAIAVPDKRFCFDYFRPVSMTGDFILAYSNKNRRHTKRTAFEHVAYTVNSENSGAWGQHPIGNLNFYSTLNAAYDFLKATEESELAPYVDFHAWCYTPSSFKLIMLELNVLGLVNWVVDVDFPAEFCEFIVRLKRGRAEFASESDLQEARNRLLQGIVADIATQYGYLQAAPPSSPEQRITVLEQQYVELADRLQHQEARLTKIWETSKMMKRMLRPVRAVIQAVRGTRARIS